jgi:DNA-binding NarL/FixJ family response regulator
MLENSVEISKPDNPIDDSIKLLYLEPDKKSFTTISALLNGWFQDYLKINHSTNYEDSIEKIETANYDIFITEIDLIEQAINPKEILQNLIDICGATEIPIIVITKISNPNYKIFAYRLGVSEYFVKSKLSKSHLQYRLSNIFRQAFRLRIIYSQINDSLKRFNENHSLKTNQIHDLNNVIDELKTKLENEYQNKINVEREKNKIQSVFGMYVDPAIVKGIINNEISLEQKGTLRELTVMFADIRGYTSLTEKMDPENMLRFLNDFFISNLTRTKNKYQHLGI